MKYLWLVLVLGTIGCTDPPTAPAAQTKTTCVFNCPPPPGCHTELSPPNNPKGYVLICD